VLVFPEGAKGTEKLFKDRYRLRRFGRGGFVKAAMKARVPIVPIALVGAEEAMPVFAHLNPLAKLTGLIYAPVAPLVYLPRSSRSASSSPSGPTTWATSHGRTGASCRPSRRTSARASRRSSST
jgi:1-acyl-sn-glycerol-3-phosphate acyltransferase